MKKKAILTAALALAMLMTGCSHQAVLADSIVLGTDIFTDRDYRAEYDEDSCALIQLDGDTATCDSNAVEISGGTVTILDEGTYALSGVLTNGMVIVDAEKTDKVQLLLNNADITSATSAAIYVRQADKVFITLADSSVNRLSNDGEFVAIDDSSIDGAIFSREDLTLNGSGSLTIDSPAGHGVVSKDELKLTGGEYAITAASHGLAGKDCVCIDGAALSIVSGKDCIHAENTDDPALGYLYIASGSLTLASDGDGLSASGQLQIDGGEFSIVSGGGSAAVSLERSDGFRGGFMIDPRSSASTSDSSGSASAKGIKSDSTMLLRGGNFSIDSADDAVHANGALTICGGSFDIATGDDGFHSDELLTISDGVIRISGCYEGLEGLSIAITGGDVSLTAVDDGLNAAGGNDQSGFGGPRGGDIFGSDANCDIAISGGTLYVNAEGDAIDSNGSLTISGGTTILSSPVSGDTSSLDYASSGVISGGVFIATGASSMNMGFSTASTQGSIMLRTDVQPAGTEIALTDENGNQLLSRTADQDFSCITLSCPELVQGGSYTLSVGNQTTEIVMESLTYGSGSSFGSFGGRGSFGDLGGQRGAGKTPDIGDAPDMGEKPDMGELPDMGGMPGKGGKPAGW